MSDDEVRVSRLSPQRTAVIALNFLLALTFAFPCTGRAQNGPPAASAGPHTLSGVVTDETGKPLADIDVFVDQLQRRTRTATTGRFRFDDVKEGKYTIGARSIGYDAVGTKISVKDSGAVVRFQLKRSAFSLASVITTAARGGLSGVVADTGMRALSNVRVRVIGQSVDLRTDSAGQFFAPLRAGKYLVRLERDGFTRQLIGVTVPADSGRNVAAWMVPQHGGDNPREGANLFDMNTRLVRSSPVSTLYFTRGDIMKTPHTDLRGFLAAVETRLIDPSCMVTINGGPRMEPIWKIYLSDIEFLEVYPPAMPRHRSGAPSGSADRMAANRSTGSAFQAGACSDQVIVWMRR